MSNDADAQEWSRHNRPPHVYTDPVTGWRHYLDGLWSHPDGPTVALWGDHSVGLRIGRAVIPDTAPADRLDAPQTLREAVLYAHERYAVPLAGELARGASPAPTSAATPAAQPAPVTREELDALAARVAALEATTAATPEPASAAARERTREDVATAPVVGDVVRCDSRRTYIVTAIRDRFVHAGTIYWDADGWAETVRDPRTDVLPMRWPE